MSDEGDFWREVRALKKEKKHKRLYEALNKPWPVEWKISNDGLHWRLIKEGEPLDYWPSTGTFRFQKKTGRCNAEQMLRFIKNPRPWNP